VSTLLNSDLLSHLSLLISLHYLGLLVGRPSSRQWQMTQHLH